MDCLKKIFLKKFHLTETGRLRMNRQEYTRKRPRCRKGLTVFEAQNGCRGGWSVCLKGRMV